MLAITAVATWTAYWQTHQHTLRLQQQLPGLRNLARRLRVDDPDQYAVARQHELWNDDFRWRVYLPPEHQYDLRLAAEEVKGAGLAPVAAERSIAPGEHELQLTCEKVDDQWRIRVLVDGEQYLSETRPGEWNGGQGSSGGAEFTTSEQEVLSQPLVLYRCRFMVPNSQNPNNWNTPSGPSNGLLLWISESRDQ